MATLLAATNLAAATSKDSGISWEDRMAAIASMPIDATDSCDDFVEERGMTDDELESSARHQGVPQRIIDTLKAEFLDTQAIDCIQSFLDAPREAWCIVLAGPKGCGKSTAAGLYLWEKTRPNHKSPPKDMTWWTAARVSRISSFNDQLDKVMKTKTIVIDDLGVEYLDKNGHFNHRLDELIDERYSNYRKTVITTNLNARDFQSRYGVRVADRIREGFKHGGAYVEINQGTLRS